MLMPLIISFAGLKGGLGKSTLAIAIATEWHRRGLRVLLVDADAEQRTTGTWAEVAAELEHAAPPVHECGDDIRSKLPGWLAASQYDVVIIDTPGHPRVGERTTYALGVSHVALLPCGPTGPEIWALDATLRQAREVATTTGLEFAILIARRQPGTVIGRRARVVLDDAEVPILDTELDYRITYGEAITGGQGPTTYAPNSLAASEIRQLIRELEARYDVSSLTMSAMGRRIARRLGIGRKRAS